MRKQLSTYVILAIALQFLFALFVDYFGGLTGMMIRAMGVKVPYATAVCCSIGHWAFLWPVIVAIVTMLLWRANPSDSTLVHLSGIIMSVSFIMLIVFVFISSFQFSQMMWSLSP